ncbi:segregation and condensation protein A [Thermostilla marina]
MNAGGDRWGIETGKPMTGTDFRVDLDVFRGPLDLLLYLVRKHEVEITEIPVSAITEQFLEFLDAVEVLDVNEAAEYLAVAGRLIEIKSHEILPRQEVYDEEGEQLREELVQRLLEYKKYRDAASVLDERSRQWQLQYRRMSDDIGKRERNPAEEPVQEVQLWDLVSAFARILRDNVAVKPSSIVYDETPIHVFMERIFTRLQRERKLPFVRLFRPGMHKSTLVGMFLACLELVRYKYVRLEQNELFGEIWLFVRDDAPAEFRFGRGDEHRLPNRSTDPTAA